MNTGPPVNENAGAGTPARDRKALSKVANIIPPRRRCANCHGLLKPRTAAHPLCRDCWRYRQLFDATRTFLELGR
jgi:hypothetical protein